MLDPATVAHQIRYSEGVLLRAASWVRESERCAQAPGLPNHPVWTMGHCALTLIRGADRAQGYTSDMPLENSRWGTGEADPSRFNIESVGYGSIPVSDGSKYPRWAIAKEIFSAAVARAAEVASGLTADQLEREVSWGSGVITAGDLLVRIGIHNGVHAGQLLDLKRALRKGGV